VAVSSVIDVYVNAVMEHASFDPIENGVTATVPEAFGVAGVGADCRDSAQNLRDRLEEWVLVCLANGRKLPIVNEIDFSDEATLKLVAYHPEPKAKKEPAFYRDVEEFDAALQEARCES
jgi:predicted RNase H-like HicB family nuclease